MTKTGTILAGTAAALVAVMGATGAAEAKGKRVVVKIGHGHHHHHKHHFHGRYFYGAPYYYSGGGCGYEKSMWWKTGSFYWKKRYYECRGWW